jgi:hypothetical protein
MLAELEAEMVAMENRTNYYCGQRLGATSVRHRGADPPASLGAHPLVVLTRGRQLSKVTRYRCLGFLDQLDQAGSTTRVSSPRCPHSSHRICEDSGHAIDQDAGGVQCGASWTDVSGATSDGDSAATG